MTVEKKSWIQRLKSGLQKSSTQLTDGIRSVLRRGKLDADSLSDIEDILLSGDLGPDVASILIQNLSQKRFESDVTDEMVRDSLAHDIAAILKPYTKEIPLDLGKKPFVLLFVGVNGSGKTTTIGKLASLWTGQGLSVRLAACDTFRAAAREQLTVWANRSGAVITAGENGADPAGLAYEALRLSLNGADDILMIDTAGRLHNQDNLMAELGKINRVLGKIQGDAPHGVILVLDGTIGQNAIAQVAAFQKCVPLSGLIVTKLDGTARGGVVVGLAQKFGLPLYAVGVGEEADDLRPFDSDVFARHLMGIQIND